MQATLDTVYRTKLGGAPRDTAPSFTVEGGTVNLYTSQRESDDAPADAGEMVLDDGSPFGVGCWPMGADVRYILWSSASGSPVVRERNIISGIA